MVSLVQKNDDRPLFSAEVLTNDRCAPEGEAQKTGLVSIFNSNRSSFSSAELVRQRGGGSQRRADAAILAPADESSATQE